MSYQIVQADSRHAQDLLQIRLEALQNHPVAFSADYEQDKNADWQKRIEDRAGVLFIAYWGSAPVGMTGIHRGRSAKTRHSAVIWGVYVNESHRRAGVAKGLFDQAIAWGKSHGVSIVKLGVAVSNIPALTFYRQYGFTIYGTEPRAILVDDMLYDEYLMALEIA